MYLLFVNTMSKNSYIFLPWADYCNGGHFWKTNHKLLDSELMKLASVSNCAQELYSVIIVYV